jgi:hypothetical protein
MPKESIFLQVPPWGSAKQIKAWFGLHEKILKDLVDGGRVRSWKQGESRQGLRLYKTQDISDYMEWKES